MDVGRVVVGGREKGEALWPWRSVVWGRSGAVATSQPLAANAGLAMLQRGGNAVDAACAAVAALWVVEPMSCGPGGDLFAIVRRAGQKELVGVNGSGRSPGAASIERLRERGAETMPQRGIESVTVPGAVDAWCGLLERCGSMPCGTVLEPAIDYALNGYPLSPIIGRAHDSCVGALGKVSRREDAEEYEAMGRDGGLARLPRLGRTLRRLAEEGRELFYRGDVARAIVRASERLGGAFGLEDLAGHRSEWVEPLALQTEWGTIWELPPNGQGVAALIACGILGRHGLERFEPDDPRAVHLILEAIKLAFAERDAHVADPEFYRAPIDAWLGAKFLDAAAGKIDPRRAQVFGESLVGAATGDTVYLATADGAGNAVSLICSLYEGYGSGVIADGTGVVLQNRGALFRLDPGHPNRLEGGKRPLHTIIPGMRLNEGEADALAFGVMGGHHQPQGHVQFLANVFTWGMDVQEALTFPRVHFQQGRRVGVELHHPESLGRELGSMGHEIDPVRSLYGGGQAVWWRGPDRGIVAGSDPRKDGQAVAL
jgi:gamma-glutamyltranspeptidase/glutathione hydrolase